MSQPSSKKSSAVHHPGAGRRPSRPTRNHRFNLRALILLGLVLVLGIPAFFGVKAIQDSRRRVALLAQARQQAEAQERNMALRSINAYLEFDPNDPEALDLKSQLLADTARTHEQIRQAIRTGERALRLDPDAPERQDTRRRLVELHLRVEQLFHPSVWAEVVQYQTAQVLVDDLIARAESTSEGPQAGDYRLKARVLEGRAVATNPDPALRAELLDGAVESFERAVAMEPDNVEGVARLAHLYQNRLDQPEQADERFKALLDAHPSVEAYLAAFRHYRVSQPERAETVLDEALRLDPDNAEVRLTAAESAFQRGDRAAARGHLGSLPEEARTSLQARTLQGMIELQSNDLDSAIDHWREGLVQVGGSDAELSWWLAYVLLQLGRVGEADPLIEQFRRLDGSEEPPATYYLLRAMRDLKTNRPAQAVETLERRRIANQVPEPLRAQAHVVLGQAYEAVQDPNQAAEAYRRASQLAPTWSTPRLSLVNLLRAERPEQAVQELTNALRENPDDPILLVSIADLLWRQQLERPEPERSWNEVERLFQRARLLAPDHPRVVLAWANFLATTRQLDKAVDQLGHVLEAEAGDARRDGDVWAARAAGLARQGKLDEALETLEQAFQPDAAGDRASLRILRARLLTQSGRGRAARAQLVEGFERLPYHQRPLVWEALANLQLAQGDAKAARQAVGQWARLVPNNPRPHLMLLDFALADGDERAIEAQVEALQSDTIGGEGNLYWQVGRVHQLLAQLRREPPPPNAPDPRLDEADRLIDEIRRNAPDQPAADLLNGLVLEQKGHVDEAITAYEAAIRTGGTRAALARLRTLLTRAGRPEALQRFQALAADALEQNTTMSFLAQSAPAVGDPAQARQAADAFLKGNPESLQAHLLAAQFLISAGDSEQAERTLRALTERQPNELGPWLALLAFQNEQSDPDAALNTIEQIRTRVSSEHPELLLAQCYRLVGRLDRAEDLFQTALDQWPDDPTVLQAHADYSETLGRLDQAEHHLRRLRALDPESDWAVRRLALLLSNRRDAPNAWTEAQELVDQHLNADAPNDRLTRALVYARAEDLEHREQAVEWLEELVADLPSSDATAQSARSVLVVLLLELDRTDAANTHAQRLNANLPNANPNASALHIETLLRTNRLDEAEAQIEQLARREPDSLRLAQLRTRLILARDPENRDEAAEVLEAAARTRLETASDATSSSGADRQAQGRDDELLQLIRLLAGLAGDLDAAARIADDLTERRPDTAWLLAEIQIARRDLDQAINALRRTLDSEASTEQLMPSFEKLIVLADDGDRLDDAEPIVVELRRQRPDEPEPLQLLALLRHLQGDYDAEIDLYEQISQLAPDDFRHLNNLAWTLSEELDQPEQALPTVERALEIAPAAVRPSILDTKGVVLTRLNRLDEAIDAFEQSLSDRPAGVTYFHLARALQQQGQDQAAETALQHAIEAGLDPRQLSRRDQAEWEALNKPGD